MTKLDSLFERLARSPFRSRFHLNDRDRAYLAERGLEGVVRHAAELIHRRLAPAHPERDGKQTPFRGHPVFVAQHATATCCRGCLAKWHGIPVGRELSPGEERYVVDVLRRWLEAQPPPRAEDEPPQLGFDLGM